MHMKYWAGRARAYGFGGASVFNPVANITVAMRMAQHGFGPWGM